MSSVELKRTEIKPPQESQPDRQRPGNSINQTPSESRIAKPSVQDQITGTSLTQPDIGPGDSGQQVEEAQQLLDEAGYPPGPLDGDFGPKTQAAAQAFQQDRIESLNTTLDNGPPPQARNELQNQIRNLESEFADGVIGEETLTQLNNAERDVNVRSANQADLGFGDSGTEVLVAQQELADAGFPAGPIDGEFGPQTLAATQEYQQSRIDGLKESRESAPPLARNELNNRITALQDELDEGIIGEATQAQFEQLDTDAVTRGDELAELGIGSRGEDVVYLQDNLDETGFFPGVADGIYGPNTGAAVVAFQQDRIDSLDAFVNRVPPPFVTGPAREQLDNLKDEQSRGVAGAETQAQLAQAVAPPVDAETAPDIDAPEGSEPGAGATPEDLDVPDAQSTLDSIKAGDINAALDSGLNSVGDTVTVELGGSVSIPTPIPGVTVGIEESVNAQIEVVDDGYEVSLGADAAVSLGLKADSDALGAGASIGAGAKVIYHFDTLDEAKQGAADLAITSGKSDVAEEAVEAASTAASVANGVADEIGGYIDNLGGPVGVAVRAFVGNVDDFADGLIERLPESFEVDTPFGSREISLGGFKDKFQEIDALRNEAEDKLNDLADAQADARARLDDSYKGFEVTGRKSDFVDLGIPSPVQVQNAGLNSQFGASSEVTGRFNADGTGSVEYKYTGSASVEGGTGGLNGLPEVPGVGDINNLGFEASGQASLSVKQNFVNDGEGFRTEGDTELKFRADAEALRREGIVGTFDDGVGGEVVYTTTAQELGGQFGNAATSFLHGDIEGALGDFGDIEGDLSYTGRSISGASFSAGADIANTGVSVQGGIKFEDRGETITAENLSIEDAFDFLTDQIEDAYEELPAIPA